MVDVTLMCALVREGRVDVFHVDIDDKKLVSHLKEAIKGGSDGLITVPWTNLRLFLAKKGDAWLTHLDVLHGVSDFTGYTQLKSTNAKLRAVGMASGQLGEVGDEEAAVGKGPVHVLVEVPRELSTAHNPRDSQFVVNGVNIYVTKNMALNPPALVDFWEAFRAVRTVVKADAVIELPKGTFFLGDSTQGSRIFIRRCYPQLLNVCWDIIHDEATSTPHFVILGNPGIGKTFFGYVLLLHIARLGATVVYESGVSKKRFLFSRDIVVQGSQQDFVRILDQPTTYYIVDAVKPPYYPARTILLTSPRRSVWFEFNKTNCRSCYMPVWSMEEILKCRELMYSDTPMGVVLDCFRRWGGIARYVLRFAQVRDQQVLLETSMDVVDLDWLVNACGQLDANDAQVSHRLLHYRVSKRFASECFVFASQYVQQEVYDRLHRRNEQKLYEFISTSDGVSALAVLRGHLFEGYVHSVLPRGGKFQIRRLVDNGESTSVVDHGEANDDDESPSEGDSYESESDDESMDVDDVTMEDSTAAPSDLDDSTIELPEQPTVVFNSDNEVKAADTSSYLRPAAKNYKSVDAIIKPDILFQMTGAHQ